MLTIVDGFRLLTRPGIRPFVLAPLAVNALVFTGLLLYLYRLAGDLQQMLTDWLPDWLDFISWLIWPVWLLLGLAVVVYGFGILCNLIAAPFNALLSEKVEQHCGYPAPAPSASFIASLLPAFRRELQKLLFSLKWLLLILVLSLLPVVNLLAVLISAWLLAVEYLDYPADNRGLRFADFLTRLRRQRLPALVFGLSVLAASLIPLVNFLVMPAAVCAGTRLWHQQRYGADG
ncbi:MAG TPA: sulfate transporter CysZ [Pseudomonadales bacterium]